ncbi:CPBP family intramembrane metalloprotease [Streptosporangiaceae bacterium NEAU-GS5]|nr:CPBP family intramembrane metalloprotease [Streptosporangiaceae bacterium NEAU-GS5]
MNRSPLKFVALTFGLSSGFWLAGAATGRFADRLPVALPVSALMASAPLLAAVLLVRRENVPGGVRRLLKRAADHGRITRKGWYVPVILTMPGVMLASYGAMRLLGRPLPELSVSLPTLAVVSVLFFAGAACEQLGWTGYAVDPLRGRWSALRTSVVLGVVWGVWHIVPYAQAGHGPGWIAWQCLYTLALRIVLGWIYENTNRSVFATIVCQATSNISWFVFPNAGSHYDPVFPAGIASAGVVLVTLTGLATGRRNRSDHQGEDMNGQLYAVRRWMYRGGRPGWLARVLNRVASGQFSAGLLSPGGAVSLEVRGRSSGRMISVPLMVADLGDQEYLVSMLGADANWVRNVRAAKGHVVLRRNGRRPVVLEEVESGLRAPILRRYLALAPGARPHLPVTRDSTAEDFEAVAPRYPVFRITDSRLPASTQVQRTTP